MSALAYLVAGAEGSEVAGVEIIGARAGAFQASRASFFLKPGPVSSPVHFVVDGDAVAV